MPLTGARLSCAGFKAGYSREDPRDAGLYCNYAAIFP